VSSGRFGGGDGDGGLNLGLKSGDAIEIVRANRARLRAVLPAEPRWLEQVHGATVADVDDDRPMAAADAAIALLARRVCVVSIADCMPVLLADRQGRAVGVAHAGWRGVAAGVVQETAAAMRARLGDASAPLLAYLGPAIGPEHFEVGAEVLTAMRERLPQAAEAFRPLDRGKYLCDLFALVRQALAQAGVVEVFGGGDCTYSDAARFYSYRRDRITGRHAALIWIET
jgi:YfiH family protein